MTNQEEKMRKCVKCGKEFREKDGYLKFGGIAFCCKNCCDDKKPKDDEKKPNVCEFC